MRYFALSVALIATLALSSCTQPKVQTPAPEQTGAVATTTSTGYADVIAATTSKIKSTPEFEACMQQNTNMCVQSVGMEIARKTKDPSFCKELNTQEQIDSCEFAVTMMNTQESGNVSGCDVLSQSGSFREQCQFAYYQGQAMNKKDKAACSKLSEVITASSTGATERAQREKDQCLVMIIMGDPAAKASDCDSLGGTGSADACRKMLENRPTLPPVVGATGSGQ